MTKDYYNILGLQKNATIEDIKKAYKRLAIKYHLTKIKEINLLKKNLKKK